MCSRASGLSASAAAAATLAVGANSQSNRRPAASFAPTASFCQEKAPQGVQCPPSAAWLQDARATLPRWLLQEEVSASQPGAKLQDVSRKEKIDAYEEAQGTQAAQAGNAAIPTAPSSGDPRKMRLVSFNVHFMKDSHMKDNLDRVLDVVRCLDADVVALQEVVLPAPASATGNDRPVAVAVLEGFRALGYEHFVTSPGFVSVQHNNGCLCGNAVFSRRPLVSGPSPANSAVVLDPDRHSEARSAAVAMVGMGDAGSDIDPIQVTIASTHLDVWAEARGHFGMAEGEMVRLLEFEELHHSLRDLPNVIVLGDFNTTSRLSSRSSAEHRRLEELLDTFSLARSKSAYRHFLATDGGGPRIPDEWLMTTLGFVEGRLGYRHCWQQWQERPQRLGLAPPSSALPPLYSHWSGQLIDHCLMRDAGAASAARLSVTHVGVFHTSASDHLPIVVDLELE
ncbi:unnamed protein product [Polarella glacialis]|uniref:Endonuclease/exonuclease/phosphatase domain-containing protein n=1 Tax=Polarella glacialis TaxID=89957 RepID=A0A813FLF2_POLGL|nr:unnamed protein product [Polarella glacialis]CAE8644632.1 unnamed protein product [Polarella glacialis]